MAKGKYKRWLEPEGLLLLEAWARNGLTDVQIAGNMGISKTTLYAYKQTYPAFSDALKKGKEVADIQVENALFKRAVGYEYEEVKTEYENGELKKTVKTTKQVVPDVVAQIYWLKNRMRGKWQDKPVPEQNIQMINDGIIALAKVLQNPMPQHQIEISEGGGND